MYQSARHTILSVTALSALTAFAWGPPPAKEATETQASKDKELSTFLPVFGCSSELKLKQIRQHFPHLGEEIGIHSDDFLPIWVQNGSIWINKDREIAAQLRHQYRGRDVPGILGLVMKNYCQPSEENTAKGSLFTAAPSVLEVKAEQRALAEAERSISPFKIVGELIPTDVPTYLKLTFIPALNSTGTKGNLRMEIFSKDSPDAESVLLDSFLLQNLKELEK
ncbi:hypothetical protein GW915_14165 [bacterium]|nr:hypothetical protein [bacterium]